MALKPNLSALLSRTLAEDYFAVYPKFCVGFRDTFETLTWMRVFGPTFRLLRTGRVPLHTAAIEALRIGRLFETVVISEMKAVRKPDRRIFELTLARRGTLAADAVFVSVLRIRTFEEHNRRVARNLETRCILWLK